MTKSDFKNLIVEDGDFGIRTIKINRPKALNALNSETLKELRNALNQARTDTTLRVLVLTGEGDKSFIAGADIAEMKGKNTSQGVQFARLGQEVTRLLQFFPVPSIAAVNGFALGGGTEMAIACDFIVASDNAVFGQPEVGLGITPGFGATVRLSTFVGVPRAKELIFSGRKVKADEAFKIGLVNHVYEKASFQKKVKELAESIALNSRSAVSAAKNLMNEFVASAGIHAQLDSEAQDFGNLFGSPDQVEGMGAFVEKRKPQFSGLKAKS